VCRSAVAINGNNSKTRLSSAVLLRIFSNFQKVAVRLANGVLTRSLRTSGKIFHDLGSVGPVLCIDTVNAGDPKKYVGRQFSFPNRSRKGSVAGNI